VRVVWFIQSKRVKKREKDLKAWKIAFGVNELFLFEWKRNQFIMWQEKDKG